MNNRLRCALIVLLAALLLMTAACPAMASDNNRLRDEYADLIVNAIFTGDEDGAYEVTVGMTRPEFESVFRDALDYVDGAREYRLSYAGTFETVVSGRLAEAAIYVLETDMGTFEVDIALDSVYNKVGLFTIYPAGKGWLDADDFGEYVTAESEEPRDLNREGFSYSLLTEKTAGEAESEYTALSVALFVFSLLTLAFVVLVLIDCIRRPLENKWVWVLLIILGALSFTAVMSDGNFNAGIKYGLLLTFSSFVRTGADFNFRAVIPVGAIIYLCLRKRLMDEAHVDKDTAAPAEDTYENRKGD